MKAILSAAQMRHWPRYFLSKGEIVDYPEQPERVRRLLEGAKRAGADIFAARNFPMTKLANVHTKAYLDFLETGFEEWIALPGAGPELMPSLRPLLRPTEVPRHILGRAGAYLMDFSCTVTADTWGSALASAMTALTAADYVLRGDPVAYALCRPPGHHAYAAAAGGFCYLNNSAIAAFHLRTKHKKVAIIDIDVHHGNGTQSIFYKRPDFFTVSIHADPSDFYPFYWGYASEIGQGHGEGLNRNIPLPVGSGDAAWLDALEAAAERVESFGATALVIALGLDAHEADPLQGGSVTTGGFEHMAARLAAMGLPAVIVQEGGYLTDHLADNLYAFLRGYEETLQVAVDRAAE